MPTTSDATKRSRLQRQERRREMLLQEIDRFNVPAEVASGLLQLVQSDRLNVITSKVTGEARIKRSGAIHVASSFVLFFHRPLMQPQQVQHLGHF